MRIREWWLRVTRTRYTRALEGEVARLRAENRALLNSVLGIAGVPPIPVPLPEAAAAGLDQSSAKRGSSPAPSAMEIRASDASLPQSGAIRQPARNIAGLPVAAPMRRRSWQQINRRLELESARKRAQSLGEGASIPGAARTTLQAE